MIDQRTVDGKTTEIIIAEDSPTQAERLRYLLERNNYRVMLAGDGQQALDRLNTSLPDLVISDIVMPVMNGYELCRRIKAVESTRDIPVILLTSLSETDDVIEGIRCGADSFITKPYSADGLLSHVAETLASRTALSTRDYQDVEVEIVVAGNRRVVVAKPQQMLTLLTSTYRAAVQRNNELVQAQYELNSINERLEDLVDERTAALTTEITKRKQTEDELRLRLAELEAVNRVSSALRNAETLDDMLPCLLDETLGVLDTKAGAIWLHDAASDTLNQSVSRGWFSDVDHVRLRPGEGISGTVFATGAIHHSHEFFSDPVAYEPRDRQLLAGWGGVCVPITSAQAAIGVLYVSVQLPRELTNGEVGLITTLADIAGNAIQRTRLHTQTEQRLNQVQALHRIDTAITARLDLAETLATFLREALTSLQVEAGAILLLNTYTGMLEYAAGLGFHTRSIEQTSLRLGAGYAGRAAIERRTVHIADLRAASGMPEEYDRLAGEEFVSYFGVPLIAKGDVEGILEIFHRSPFDGDSDWLYLLETLAAQAAIAVDNAALLNNLQRANTELAAAYATTVLGWSRALDLRDKETEGHSTRVTIMTVDMARAMGIEEEDIEHVRHGALLHDIGKMGIPDSILLKPGPLTDAEWLIMRKHPVFAYEMLAGIEYLQLSLDIPYNHHEKWDGTGYPRGLKGEDIPLVARIFAVVDVYDALTSVRPYREAWTRNQALDYIREQSGKHFDPKVVEVFWQVALGDQNKS